MFWKDFDEYNRERMRAEDPNRDKWCERKLFLDYTACVTSADWAAALLDFHTVERARAQNIIQDAREDRCVLCKRFGLCQCTRAAIEEYGANQWGPDSSAWDWFVTEHGGEEAETLLRHARATGGSLLQRRMSFTPASLMSQYSTTVPYAFFTAINPFEEGGCSLLWIGGTYAKNPQSFPQEQSSVKWFHCKLRPLRIAAPAWFTNMCKTRLRQRAVCQLPEDWSDDFERIWKTLRWHGNAPHPYALQFPLAFLEAMRKKR